MDDDLRACLPEALRGGATRIERIAPGMSGAGVYRVDAEGKTYVLKIAGGREPFDDWKRATQVLAAAGRAGVAPVISWRIPSGAFTRFRSRRNGPARTRASVRALSLRGLLIDFLKTHELPKNHLSENPSKSVTEAMPQAQREIDRDFRSFETEAATAGLLQRLK